MAFEEAQRGDARGRGVSEADCLVETGGDQRGADIGGERIAGRAREDFAARQRGGDLVEPMEAGDLVDEVHFAREIDAEARTGDAELVAALLDPELDRLEVLDDGLG